MKVVTVFGLALWTVGCGSTATAPRDHDAVRPPNPAPQMGLGSPEPEPAPPAIALADQPRISLAANRPRWHVRDRGLVLPVGTTGLAKYEPVAKSAWSAIGSTDGHSTRQLLRTATLTWPWLAEDGDAESEVIITGLGPAKLAVSLDGKSLGTATLAAGWGEARVSIAEGRLAGGEHTLSLAGPRTSIARIEIAPVLAPASCSTGMRRISLYGELPSNGYLLATPTGATKVAVRVATEGQPTRTIFEGNSVDLPRPLALFDGESASEPVMARLDLDSDDCALWDETQIAVPAPAVASALAPVDNVVMIVVDTLRSDSLSAYGPTRVKTPRIDAIAARGAVFVHNQSVAPSSPPSHAAIHTGQIPRVHGITGDETQLAADAPLLPRLLGDAGFFTGFVGNNDFAMSRLRAPARWDVAETPFYKHGKDCAPIMARAVELISKAVTDGKRFFVSTLPIEPHVAYRFHEGITDAYFAGPWSQPLGKLAGSKHLARMKKLPGGHRDFQQLRALYDGEVTHVDACIGVLEDGLRAAGVLDRTAIVITSDHGEGMGERLGSAGHAYSLNHELVNVPLIIAGGVAPSRVVASSSNADIAPTVLALLGLPVDQRMQGLSLLPQTQGPALPRIVASEYGRSYALASSGYQLVVGYSGRGELFHTQSDPAEQHELGDSAPIALRALRDAAGMFLAYRIAWRSKTYGSLNDLAVGNPLL